MLFRPIQVRAIKAGDKMLRGHEHSMQEWDVDEIGGGVMGVGIWLRVSRQPFPQDSRRERDCIMDLQPHEIVWCGAPESYWESDRKPPEDIYDQIDECAREIMAHMGGHSVSVIPIMDYPGVSFELRAVLLGRRGQLKCVCGHGDIDAKDIAARACKDFALNAAGEAVRNGVYAIEQRKRS